MLGVVLVLFVVVDGLPVLGRVHPRHCARCCTCIVCGCRWSTCTGTGLSLATVPVVVPVLFVVVDGLPVLGRVYP